MLRARLKSPVHDYSSAGVLLTFDNWVEIPPEREEAVRALPARMVWLEEMEAQNEIPAVRAGKREEKRC